MKKTIIVLTKSNKHGHYCIAGVDVNTGEWIRPVSDNESLEGAVLKDDAVYEDGTEVQIFDVISVEFICHQPTKAQDENWLYNSEFYWEKVGESSLDEVIRLRGFDDDDYIFVNNQKSLEEYEIQGISLMMVEVTNPIIFIKTFSNGRQIQLNFTYNNRQYKYLKISDEKVLSEYCNMSDGEHSIHNTETIIFSLTGKYNLTDKYYKMVAQIF